MEKLSSLWLELQKNNKLPGGGLTSSCQEELLELMRQLDIMLSTKKREWEHEREAIRSQLDSRDKELQIRTTTLNHKNKQVEDLSAQLNSASQTRDDLMHQYEEQVLELKKEVQRMKHDYEKLHKKHARHTKEAQQAKLETTTEIEEGKSEIKRLKDKLKVCQENLKQNQDEKRSLRKQAETLESQKRALTDKCQFVQQQSETYQSQLDKRRQLQDNTEISLKTTITQLEGQLQRTTETSKAQHDKIKKLKAALSEAMNAHKRAMNDNERLLDDLKKANSNIRQLEREKQQLEVEVKSREDFLRVANEDAHQYSHDMSLLEQSLAAKDDIIKSFGDSARQEESEQIKLLRESLHEARDACRSQKKHEKKLRDEVSVLESKLGTNVQQRDNMAKQLEEKERELDLVRNREVRNLESRILQLEDQLRMVENSHGGELDGMKLKLTQLTTELHQRNSAVATMTEKTVRMEHDFAIEKGLLDGKQAELKLALAQIESLRVENRHLREDFMEKLGAMCGQLETGQELQEVTEHYRTIVQKLEQDNESLRDEMERLHRTKSPKAARSSFYDSNQADMHLEGSMQSYLDATADRYDSEIRLLKAQKDHLEEELRIERGRSRRGSLTRSLLNNSAGTVLDSEPMSIVHTFQDLGSPRESIDYELESSAEAAAELFLSQEQERAKELERLIDSHIEDLRAGTERTIKQYSQR